MKAKNNWITDLKALVPLLAFALWSIILSVPFVIMMELRGSESYFSGRTLYELSDGKKTLYLANFTDRGLCRNYHILAFEVGRIKPSDVIFNEDVLYDLDDDSIFIKLPLKIALAVPESVINTLWLHYTTQSTINSIFGNHISSTRISFNSIDKMKNKTLIISSVRDGSNIVKKLEENNFFIVKRKQISNLEGMLDKIKHIKCPY